jgi:hypothetical protein
MVGRADGMKWPSWPANATVPSVSFSAASVQNPELFHTPISGRCSEPPESNKAVYRPLMAGKNRPTDGFDGHVSVKELQIERR